MHMDKLEEWLPDQDSRYDTLLRHGWALDRQLECCVNNLHIEALKDPKSGLPEGSFAKPLLASTEFAALLAEPPGRFFQLRDAIMNVRPSDTHCAPGSGPRGGVEPSAPPERL